MTNYRLHYFNGFKDENKTSEVKFLGMCFLKTKIKYKDFTIYVRKPTIGKWSYIAVNDKYLVGDFRKVKGIKMHIDLIKK